MGADRIKGISIKIGADMTELNDALKGTQKSLQDTQKNLRDVNKLLKLDPNNTTLLAQKQKLLGEQVKNTKDKLDQLKDAEAQMAKQDLTGEQQKQFEALQREIISTEHDLESYARQLDNLNTIKIDNRFTDKIQTIGKSFESAGSKISNAGNKISSAGSAITKTVTGTVTAVVAAGAGVFAFAEKTAKTGDEIDKMSQRLGLSRKAYQELDFVLSQSGVDINSFQTGMKSLLANMDKTTEGNETAIANFKKLGVSVTDSNGKLRNQEEVLSDVIIAFQGMEDSAAKSRLAQELFGKQGQEILPLLNSEAGSFEDLIARANELGIVLDDDAIDASVKFTDTLDELKRAFGSIVTEIGAALLPYIQDFADYIIDNMPRIREIVAEVGEKFKDLADKVYSVIQWLRDLDPDSQKMVGTFGAIAAAIGPIMMIAGKFTSTIGGIVGAIGKAMKAAPEIEAVLSGVGGTVAAVVAVVAILAAAFATLWKNSEEFRNNITGTFQRIKYTISDFCDGIVQRLNDMGGDFGDIFDVLKTAWEGFTELLAPIFEGVFTFIADKIEFLTGIITGIVDVVGGIFTGDWERVWQGAGEVIGSWVDFVGNTLSNLGQMFGDLINVVLGWFGTSWQEVWQDTKDFFVDTWQSISDFFVGIWQGISDFFSPIIEGIVDVFQSAWDWIYQYIVPLLTAIWELFSNIFLLIKQVVTDKITEVHDKIVEIWDKIYGYISPVLDKIKDVIDKAWTWIKEHVIEPVMDWIQEHIVSAFDAVNQGISDKMEAISNTLSGVWETIKGFFSGLAESAFSWGVDLISGFIEGIESMISWLTSTISNLAAGVAEYLHFSRPDKGPLRDYETWMPDFIGGLAKGIEDNMYKIKDAVGGVSATMSGALTSGLSGSQSAIAMAAAGNTTTYGDMVVNVYGSSGMDVNELANAVQDKITTNLMRGARSWR